MEIRIDEQANAAYVRLASGAIHETRTVGEFGVDYSRTGRVLGIEIVGLRQYLARYGSIKIPPGFWGRRERPDAAAPTNENPPPKQGA